jgi:diguanylate cyclase (GGDEF)-like protein
VLLVASLVVPEEAGLGAFYLPLLWITVIAIGIRYSTPSAYVVGVAAAVSSALTFFLRPDIYPASLPIEEVSQFVQSFLLFAGGIVAGGLVHGLHQRLAAAEEGHQQAGAKLETLSERYEVLAQVKCELERQIVDSPASVVTLYEAAKRLQTLHAPELYRSILDLLGEVLGASACALYAQRGGHLGLRAARPEVWPGRPDAIHEDGGLVHEALRERRVVTIHDRLSRVPAAELAHEPVLMAGPLLGHGGEPIGLLVVERLPFLKLTPTNVRLFGLIVDWASTALQNASRYEQTDKGGLEDDLTGAYTAVYTMRRLEEEFLRARRHELPLSIVLIELTGLLNLPVGHQSRLTQSLVTFLHQRLRPADLVGHLPCADKLLVILPLAKLEEATSVARRIEAEAAALTAYSDDARFSLKVGVGALSPELSGPLQMLARALADLQQCRLTSRRNGGVRETCVGA